MKKRSLLKKMMILLSLVLLSAVAPGQAGIPAQAVTAKLSVTQTTIETGKKKTLKVSGAKVTSWKSSDTKVATVSSKGAVKARKKGVCTITAVTSAGNLTCKVQIVPKAKTATEKILALKDKYPEGTPWTSKNTYTFKNLDGKSLKVTECQAFAFEVSDAAYGSLPAYISYDWGQLRPGDVIFLTPYAKLSDGATASDIHACCVQSVDYSKDELMICEGNRAGKVHWDAKLTVSEMAEYAGRVIITRGLPENGKTDPKRPAAEKITDNKKDKAEDGYTYNFVYCKKLEENCTGYQFLVSDKENLPWRDTDVYYRGRVFNYIYGNFDSTCYVKVRAFYETDGKILYGEWSEVKKVKI